MNKVNAKKVIRKVVTDWCCIIIVAVSILLFELCATPYKRGFFCNDESINYPLLKQETVSLVALHVVGFGAPILVVFLTEYIHVKQWSSKRGVKDLLSGCTLSTWAWQCHKVISVFLFGAACCIFMTDIAKYEIGRLRPHFMDACRPNINCSLPENEHRYFEDFKCLNTDANALREMRLSFLSGHSSFSSYVMTFLGMYMHVRWTWRGTKLILHVGQLAAFMLAWFTALSRVSDYRHHWSDVLAGSLEGTLVAVITVVFVSDLCTKANNNLNKYNTLNEVKLPPFNKTAVIDVPCNPVKMETANFKESFIV